MTGPVYIHRQLSADFLTSSYRVVGKLMVSNAGVIGLINDKTSSFMEVTDAKLAPIHMPTRLVGEYKVIDLVKTNLFAVCLTRREDVGPQVVARGGYKNLVKYTIRVASSIYELEGTLEWAGRFDFASVMVEGVNDYIPLYQATLTAILIPTLSIESPAILFNRRLVEFLTLITEKKPV
jgi:hypothetical protein